MYKYILQTFLCLSTPCLLAWSSVSTHGKARYRENSSHLSYANPLAPKGGSLRLGMEGSFDTLTPYTAKGYQAYGMSLVFQTLGQKVLDEADTSYPQVAENFLLAPDGMSMKVKLYKHAKFSDGHPVSSEDVAFSFAALRSAEASPYYKAYWSEIKDLKIISPHEFQVNFARFNKELPALVTDIPVLPKHIYGQGNFSRDFANQAIGTGPYVVEAFKFGSMIRFRRNPEFWAKDNFLNKGRYNFDRITVEYYRDPVPLVEGFKNGAFDFFPVYLIKVWQNDLRGEKFARNWIVKEEWKHQMNLGAAGYFFNLRKPIFQDIRVRKAIALAFDFAWTNRTLFNNQYLESESIYENSVYKARGLPDKRESVVLLALKKEFPSLVPDEVLKSPIGVLGKGMSIEERLSKARSLLKEAGYSLRKGVLDGPGGVLSFRLLVRSRSALRMAEPFQNNLARIGIKVGVEVKDRSIYMQKLLNRDFDLSSLMVRSSASPGQEQIALWGSASADEQASRNYYGLANGAVDRLLERLIASKNSEEQQLATRCLDRLIYHLHIAVPNWYADHYRLAFWNKLGRPSSLPPYFFESEMIEFMWLDPAKEKRLQEAMRKSEKI